MGPEGRVGARSACGAADANGLVLGKGGWRPRNIVALMLAGAWSEVKDGPSKCYDFSLFLTQTRNWTDSRTPMDCQDSYL